MDGPIEGERDGPTPSAIKRALDTVDQPSRRACAIKADWDMFVIFRAAKTQNGHLSRDYSFSSPHISHLSAGSCSPFLTGPFHSKIWLQALSTLLSPGKLFAFSQSLSFLLHRRRINPGLMGASLAESGISWSFEPQRFFPPHIFLAPIC